MKTPAPRANGALLADVGAWALNVSTSVMIVFVNKVLMDPRHGHGFGFATSLCALHFAVSALAIKLTEWAGYSTPVKLPLKGEPAEAFELLAHLFCRAPCGAPRASTRIGAAACGARILGVQKRN